MSARRAAHVTEGQAMAAESKQAEDDEERTIELDLSDLPEEQAHALVSAARASGLRVRAPFQRASGKKPFARPKFTTRPPTSPRTGGPWTLSQELRVAGQAQTAGSQGIDCWRRHSGCLHGRGRGQGDDCGAPGRLSLSAARIPEAAISGRSSGTLV